MAEREPEQIDFEDELRRCYHAQPFSSFEIVTCRGDRYEVTDPSQLAFGNSAIVVIPPKRGIQIIRKNQITAVHVPETA